MTSLSDKPKMDDRTRKALEESIAKWERNAVAETPDQYNTEGWDCPLCIAFARCDGCPVYVRTGRRFCCGTPYSNADHARDRWAFGIGTAQTAHAAARDEVAFLKSLLPQDDDK